MILVDTPRWAGFEHLGAGADARLVELLGDDEPVAIRSSSRAGAGSIKQRDVVLDLPANLHQFRWQKRALSRRLWG